jgi:hypothetical protein
MTGADHHARRGVRVISQLSIGERRIVMRAAILIGVQQAGIAHDGDVISLEFDIESLTFW